jgi:hypothetical protein
MRIHIDPCGNARECDRLESHPIRKVEAVEVALPEQIGSYSYFVNIRADGVNDKLAGKPIRVGHDAISRLGQSTPHDLSTVTTHLGSRFVVNLSVETVMTDYLTPAQCLVSRIYDRVQFQL